MTFAEKHYRATFKIKPLAKLTNAEWKIVNMMHRCLQENNKPKLPHGTMLVNTKDLKEYVARIDRILNDTDAIMLKPQYIEISKGTFGSELGKIWTRANMVAQSIKHFQLNIPLEKLNDNTVITQSKPKHKRIPRQTKMNINAT